MTAGDIITLCRFRPTMQFFRIISVISNSSAHDFEFFVGFNVFDQNPFAVEFLLISSIVKISLIIFTSNYVFKFALQNIFTFQIQSFRADVLLVFPLHRAESDFDFV